MAGLMGRYRLPPLEYFRYDMMVMIMGTAYSMNVINAVISMFQWQYILVVIVMLFLFLVVMVVVEGRRQ